MSQPTGLGARWEGKEILPEEHHVSQPVPGGWTVSQRRRLRDRLRILCGERGLVLGDASWDDGPVLRACLRVRRGADIDSFQAALKLAADLIDEEG